ncbi:MAG TPA: DUF885 domain-containing protein [Acidimicrobiales bacterium]|jgi:uncharacterized protein (DUF885 family)|nr:DUF885 domain-containing protein [Acidimicrobiales bacterium]
MTLSARLADLREEMQAGDPSTHLHALFDAIWEHRIESEPELATYLGEPGPTHRWTDHSLEAFDRRKDDAVAALEALRAVDPAALDDVDRTSLRLAIYEHQQQVDRAQFPYEFLAASTMEGPQVDIPQVMSLMPARTIGDLEDVVARLSGVSVYIDQTIALLDEGRAAGVTIPRVVAEQVAPSVGSLVEAPAAESPLLLPFESSPDGIDPSDVDDLRAEALEAVTSATSALRRFAAYLDETYVPSCRETTAFTALPDGDEWYAQLVRHETTTEVTPAEIHAIGVDEVARIRKEMESVITSTGYSGSFAGFAELLRTDKRFYFDTAEALLAHYRDIAKRADAELPRLFGLLPRLPYGVKAVPEHEAPTAPAAFYLPGSIELGRPGWFCANTYDLDARPTYEMEATCLHEGVPGHHMQIAIAAELEGLPKFRTKSWAYTAYVEGWGLYAESLGAEMGFYSDPYNRFGQLSSELWRAIRLVVDTGMHALGWSRERAIDYCVENSTATMHEIRSEIDRYLSIPGQALTYKLGELTIQRLRREASAALGSGFDLRSFHDLMLGAGPLPLDVLEERTRAWINHRDG